MEQRRGIRVLEIGAAVWLHFDGAIAMPECGSPEASTNVAMQCSFRGL